MVRLYHKVNVIIGATEYVESLFHLKSNISTFLAN